MGGKTQKKPFRSWRSEPPGSKREIFAYVPTRMAQVGASLEPRKTENTGREVSRRGTEVFRDPEPIVKSYDIVNFA